MRAFGKKHDDSFRVNKTSEKMWQLQEKPKFVKRNEFICPSWLSGKLYLYSSHSNENTD